MGRPSQPRPCGGEKSANIHKTVKKIISIGSCPVLFAKVRATSGRTGATGPWVCDSTSQGDTRTSCLFAMKQLASQCSEQKKEIGDEANNAVQE